MVDNDDDDSNNGLRFVAGEGGFGNGDADRRESSPPGEYPVRLKQTSKRICVCAMMFRV